MLKYDKMKMKKKTGNERCNVTAGTHERIAAQVFMGNTSRLLLVSSRKYVVSAMPERCSVYGSSNYQ